MREIEKGEEGREEGKGGKEKGRLFLQDNFNLNVERMSEITIKGPQQLLFEVKSTNEC